MKILDALQDRKMWRGLRKQFVAGRLSTSVRGVSASRLTFRLAIASLHAAVTERCGSFWIWGPLAHPRVDASALGGLIACCSHCTNAAGQIHL